MIIKRLALFYNTNTFLGKKITFVDTNKPGFDISKMKVTLDDFYKDILDWNKNDKTSYKLTPQNIKSRVKIDEVSWRPDFDDPEKISLGVYFIDSKTGLTYSFKFRSPSDPVEIEYCFD